MILKDLQIELKKEDVLKEFKAKSTTGNILERLESALSSAKPLLEPKACCKDYNHLKTTDTSITLSDFTIQSKNIANLLKNSSRATLFATTIGPKLNRKIDQLSGDDILTASLFDLIGSTAVEKLTSHVNNLITARAASENYTTTPRFSCGYGDWQITDQPKILDALAASDIGISANQSCMMSPEKSVTAILGWEPNKSV